MQTVDSSKGRSRDASIDVFRCLLMFLIVLHHSAFHGHWATDTSMWFVPVLFTLAIFWHVDGFIAISGWYGIRFSFSRFFKIFGLIIFYSIVRFVVMVFVLREPLSSSCKVAAGWFGSVYLAFMFIVPLLNEAVSSIAKWDRSRLWSMLLVFNVGMILCWRPISAVTGFAWGGGGGCSMQTFCFVYVNMRIIHLIDIQNRITLRHIGIVCLIYLSMTVLVSVIPAEFRIARGISLTQGDWIGFTTYNSPHSVLMAIAAFLFFYKYVRLPEWVNAIARKISPLMFGVYLMHEATGVGRMLYILPQRWASSLQLHPVLIIFSTAVLT